MRKIGYLLIVLVIAGGVTFFASPVNRIYLPTATGISAKQACSLHFVSGLPLARARALYIDPLLAEPAGGGRDTLAVVVLHQGRLVAERYSEGIDSATPLHGWSMTKSVIAALAARALQDELGDALPAQIAGLGNILFDPLDIHSAVVEVDQRGTFQGQYAIIVPSHELVVVRFGATHRTGAGIFQFVLDVIAAMDADPSDELT